MNQLKTFFKKSNWKINRRLISFGISSEADWRIIFISAVVLVVLAVFCSALIFIKIDKGDIFSTENLGEETGAVLDIAKLKETVSYYQNKASEFERIVDSGGSSVDPSR